MRRRFMRGAIVAMLLLLCGSGAWFAFSPQLEVMFARNTLLYRLEPYWGAPSASTETYGTLFGEVAENMHEFIAPLANAEVILSDANGHTFTAQTDGRGRYKINVPPGVYVPTATNAGYEDTPYQNFIGMKTHVEVKPSQTYQIDFKLKRAPSRAQTADASLTFFDDTVAHTDVTQPTDPSAGSGRSVRRRGFSFVRAGTVLTSSYVYEPLGEGRYPVLLFIYPCARYPCSTLDYDIVSATMAAQGFVVVTFSPQRGFDLEGDMDDILKLIAHIKAGQLSAKGDARKLALLAGSLTSVHLWRVAQLAPPDSAQAIVTLGGVSDIFLMRQRFEENALDLEPPVIRELVSSALIGLGRPNLNPELYLRYSVAYHVDALPRIPIALLHGGGDKTVPVEQTPRLSEQLTAHGRPHTTYIFPHQEHYLQLAPPTPEELDMLEKVVGFLRRALR